MIYRLIQRVKQNWLLAVILSILTIIVLTISFLYSQAQTQKTISEFSNHLNTLASLKSSQITIWINERTVDAQTIQKDKNFAKDINLFLKNPNNLSILKDNQNRLQTLLLDPNYSSIFLVDSNGEILLQVGNLDEKPGLSLSTAIIETNITHEVKLSDLYLTLTNSARMDMVVPISLAGGDNQPAIAFLVYLIDPDPIFFPLIQSLPSNYQTVETLLVRKYSGGALYLNELRFKEDTALKYWIPSENTNTPAIMAVNGTVGIVNGDDYRGIPVMASITPVQDTEWKLIAKLDWDEVYSPIRKQFWATAFSAVLVIVAAGLILNIEWRKKTEKITKGLSESETQRRNLQEKYSTLFNQANDAILLIEENGKIIEANDQAVKMYGYSLDELLSLSISDLRDEKVIPQIRKDMEHVKNGTINIFETTHRKKNGEKFTVDVSSRYLSIGNKGFFQSLVRDITQKKQAEDQLRRSELDLKKAQQVSHVGSWYWDAATNKIDRSDEMYQILGLDRDTSDSDFYELFKTVIHPDDQGRIKQILDEASDNKELYSFEARITRPDGIERDIWVEAGELFLDDQGRLEASSGIVQDITEKKIAEREIRKSENLLQKIYELLPVGLWITDKSGRLVRSNKMVKEIWGKDILVGLDEFNVFHGRRLPSREEIKPDDWASVHTIKEGVTIRDEMVEIDAYDGKTKTILNYSTPILSENGEMEGAIVLNLDISELKNAEKQLSNQLDELRRWNLATLGRENRIRDLKLEINELLVKQGLPPKYQSVTGEDHD